MKKACKTLAGAVILMLLIPGCASSPRMLKKDVGGEILHDTFRIKPGRSYEECIELRPGMTFDYEFNSSKEVDFNIHYHGADKIYYPVDESNTTGDSGSIDPLKHDFYIQEQEAYCLMWENITYEPVRVSFTCVVKGKK